MVDKRRVSPELWWKVYERDHRRCIAPQLDAASGPCLDRWGNPVRIRKPGSSSWGTTPYDLTLAHIKRPPDFLRITDEQHAVMACWGHHVFGTMWITSKQGLELVRAYLESIYGQSGG